VTSSLTLAPATLIPDLLAAAPQARAVLDRYGRRGCGGPLGPHESIQFFARSHDVPVERLPGELRGALATPAPQVAGLAVDRKVVLTGSGSPSH
jgi:hypothetical protein